MSEEQPLDGSHDQDPSRRSNLKRKALAIGAVAMSAIAMGLGAIKADTAPQVNTIDFGGDKIAYKSWDNFDIPHVARIEPDSNLKVLINNRDPLFKEYNLDADHIQSESKFTLWVQNQLKSESVTKNLQKRPDEMTAKDLVKASEIITDRDLKYSGDEDANVKTAKQPLDKVLIESMPAACEISTAAQQAIFRELKRMYPEKLANTYMVENAIYANDGSGHYVNAVITLGSSHEASVTLSDVTNNDPHWHHNPEMFRDAENFSGLLTGLNKRGVTTNL